MRWLLMLFAIVLVGDVVCADDTTTPLIWVEFDVDPTPYDTGKGVLDFPDACIQIPEVTTRQNGLYPAAQGDYHRISGPGRLMRRDAAGIVTTLFDCEALGRLCMPEDPRLSPDGLKVAFTLYFGTELSKACGHPGNTMLAGTGAGAHIAIHDLKTGVTTEWPAVPGQHDVTPVIIQQGAQIKVMFSSDRARVYEPIIRNTSAEGLHVLQTYIADLDGTNVIKTGTHDFSPNYGGYQLKDGRIISSCAQWGHDLGFRNVGPLYTNWVSTLLNMWWACGQDPWGGSNESIFGAHYSGKALHFFSQMTDGSIVVGEYYRGNKQQGAGRLLKFSPQPFNIEGVPVSESLWENNVMPPRDLVDITPWANPQDAQSFWDSTRNQYQGRVRDPFGLPNNELGFVWCKGICNYQSGASFDMMDEYAAGGPSRTPGLIADPMSVELGIYKLPANKIPSTDYGNDPVLMVDRRHVAEHAAIYGGPYIDVHGQATPTQVAQPTSGNKYCYLRIASMQSDTRSFQVQKGTWRWGHDEISSIHGKELPGVADSDVKYIRIAELIPNTVRPNNFAGVGTVPYSFWGYRSKSLGEAPVETDGSAYIQVPCETPWVLSGLNAERETVKHDQMPQSLRTGTTLTCGGCHLHNDVSPQPVFENSIAAGKPPQALQNPRPMYEYSADIVPIINNRCASCHNGPSGQGGLNLNDGSNTRSMITRDYAQTTNPNPVVIHTPAEGYGGAKQYILDRPLASWLVHGSSSAGSPLYWYFKNERADYRTNADSAADIDYNVNHPNVATTAGELQVVRDWIDTGLQYDPAVVITPYSGSGSSTR
ncbi:hypothetical protein O4G98_02245 [Zoogloeaceae bacterium G21618-S1]|nr:hypothetical protein [Zoogloeaceae bacterium G21618-S1]